MKKIISLTMATMIAALSFAGCGNTGGTTSDASKAEGNKTETGTLKIAALETAYKKEPWENVKAAYEKANPDLKIEMTVDAKLEDVIGPQMKSGNYPDVIHLAVGQPSGMTETFIKDNNIVELSDMLSKTIPGESVTVKDKIAGGFIENSITNPYEDGKTYLAPTAYGPCGLFYNTGLFKEKGWEVPKTWDEMWALAETAKAEDISLFTYPTAGYFDAFFYALLQEVGGQEFFDKAMSYEEGIWDTEEAKEAFAIMEKLLSYTDKTVPANANKDNFVKNQQLVLDNKAIFMPNGNWVISEMANAPRAEGFEWGFMALPSVTEGGDRYSYTFFEQMWMPKGAKNQEEGKNFMAYMYSDEAADIFAKAGAIQPIKDISSKLEGDMKVYYSIYDDGAKAAMGAFASTDPVEGVSMADAAFAGIDSVVNGSKTANDWIEGIKKASDQLRPALKK